MSHLSLVQDGDRAFIERLTAEYNAEMASCFDSPSLTPEDLNAGPWYMGREFGHAMDDENSREIASRAWKEFGIGDVLAGWTSDFERVAVGDSFKRIAFKGIYWGRMFAGNVIDNERALDDTGAEAIS